MWKQTDHFKNKGGTDHPKGILIRPKLFCSPFSENSFYIETEIIGSFICEESIYVLVLIDG